MFSYWLPLAFCSGEILISVALVAFFTNNLRRFCKMIYILFLCFSTYLLPPRCSFLLTKPWRNLQALTFCSGGPWRNLHCSTFWLGNLWRNLHGILFWLGDPWRNLHASTFWLGNQWRYLHASTFWLGNECNEYIATSFQKMVVILSFLTLLK